jgi:hypothetical protein
MGGVQPPLDLPPLVVEREIRRDNMTKLELLTVLRSVKLALKNGSKEQVEELIDDLIEDAQGDKTKNKE